MKKQSKKWSGGVGRPSVSEATVVLPAYNEEAAIGKVIDDIKKLGGAFDILVVDNGSTDGTVEVVKGRNVPFIHELEQGKAAAIRAALRHIHTPYVLMMDSDATYPTEILPRILALLKDNGDDVVMGGRAWPEEGAMPRTNRIGNRLLSLMASLLYGQKVFDVCTGMWGFKKSALDRFYLVGEHFTLEGDLFTNAARRGCKITQIPIRYRARPSGSAAKLRIWDGVRIGWFLIKRRFL